nr:TRAP transporter substrate-binding protein DctP [Herbaspirillum sp. B39]
MAQAESLVNALKNLLKARGITYAQLAKGLGLSEASVKRIFAERSFTLERLDQVCTLLGIQISDLARMVVAEQPVPSRLTEEQEKKLVADPKLMKVMTANRPLHKVADFRALKMRIQSSKVLDEQFRALKANPQVLAFSEVYQAMQTGVVDGSENTPSNVYTQKMHEVQSNLTVSDHGYIGYAVIVNKKFWEALPADVRSQLEGAMKEATVYANTIAQKENDDALAAIKASGKTKVYTLSEDEKAEWRRALLPVHKSMASRVGQDLIDAIYKESEAAGVKMN